MPCQYLFIKKYNIEDFNNFKQLIVAQGEAYRRAYGQSNKKYEIWYEQGEAFLQMIDYDELEDFDNLLLAWTDLNLVDSKPSFVKDEAVAYVKGKLSEVKELASGTLESRETKEVIELIRLIEKRMGTLKMFESEIEELINLKQEMEG